MRKKIPNYLLRIIDDYLNDRWVIQDTRGLKMAREKTEALLVADRRSFQYPRFVLGEHEVEWETSIKYLGV